VLDLRGWRGILVGRIPHPKGISAGDRIIVSRMVRSRMGNLSAVVGHINDHVHLDPAIVVVVGKRKTRGKQGGNAKGNTD
jgi:hypothetical protein